VLVGTFSQDKEEGLGSHWVHEQVTTPHHDYRTWALPELTHMVRPTYMFTYIQLLVLSLEYEVWEGRGVLEQY
jgi:hypothetical protein